MDIIIAGAMGFVGKELCQLFPNADKYDIKNNCDIKEQYDYCFIAVPTPKNKDGSCDISAVKDVYDKITADTYICLSTVFPQACEELGDDVVFQPEYSASSSPYPAPLSDITKRSFIIIGGKKEYTKKVRKLYETLYPPTTKILETDSRTAEVIKLCENTAIAAKVSLCNEFYEICNIFGVDYDIVREGVFGLDPRFTEWFTYVYRNKRGWGGHCLPKDISNLIVSCEKAGYIPKLIKDIVENNERHKSCK